MIEIIKLNRALSAVHSSNIFFFLNEKLEKPIIVKRKARKLKLMINLECWCKNLPRCDREERRNVRLIIRLRNSLRPSSCVGGCKTSVTIRNNMIQHSQFGLFEIIQKQNKTVEF